MTSNTNPLLNEQVTFIQHRLPGLDDGRYQLTVSQSVSDSSGSPISGDSLVNTYTFAVRGDRFSLSKPAQSIGSVFPPLNATGEFSTVLPHVVLTAQTFPWARFPTSTLPFSPPLPGSDTDADVPTWLAVLLLDEDDVAAFPGLRLSPANATVGDLFPVAANASSSLGADGYSYFWSNQTVSDLAPGEATTDSIRVLDLPLDLFWSIAPTVADLQLTAHVRQISLLRTATGRGTDPGASTGSFSIVFGTRLPQTRKKAYAYLVSLEQMQPFLSTSEQGDPPAAPSGVTFTSTSFIRLAVLTSWTFYSTGETATFVDDLLALNGRAAGDQSDAANTVLRLDYDGDSSVVQTALDLGYTPLNETLRTAGATVSWYRGPCAPHAVPPQQLSLPIASPDQATIFDPTTGMFDVSYAAAWTLGRMLALQDTAFSTALYNWKKGLTQRAVAAIEASILAEAFTGAPTTGSLTSDAAAASRALLEKTIHALRTTE
jgi:hypothetical protein